MHCQPPAWVSCRVGATVLALLLLELARGRALYHVTADELNCEAFTSAAILPRCLKGAEQPEAFRQLLYTGAALCISDTHDALGMQLCTPGFLNLKARDAVANLFAEESWALMDDIRPPSVNATAEVCTADFNFWTATPQADGSVVVGTLLGTALATEPGPPGKRPDAAVTSAACAFGDLAPAGALKDLSQLMMVDQTLDWADILLPVRHKLATYSGTSQVVPLDGSVLLLVYRSDVLAAMDLQAPQTWDDLVSFVETYNTSTVRPSWAPAAAFCVMTGPSCDGSQLLEAIWHSIAQSKGLQQGVFFDRFTMRPNVETAAFMAAAQIFAKLWSQGLQPAQGPCGYVHPGMRRGDCAVTIGTFEQVKDIARATTPVSDAPASSEAANATASQIILTPNAFGVSLLPGSSYVGDPENPSSLVPCTRAACPYGDEEGTAWSPPTPTDIARHPAAAQRRHLAQADIVNRVPYVPSSLLVGAISSRSAASEQLLAWYTLAYLASPRGSLQLLCSPGSNVAPFRTSHFSRGARLNWSAMGYDAVLMNQGLDAQKASLLHPNLGWGLYIPGSDFYRSAVSRFLARMPLVSSTSLPSLNAELSQGVQELQQELAEHFNSPAALAAQYQTFLTLGGADVVVSPSPTPQQPPTQGSTANGDAAIHKAADNSDNGDGSSKAKVISLAVAVTVGGLALLVIGLYLAHRRSRGLLFPRPRKPDSHCAPAVSPETTLLITDIEGSTRLWEELPEVVMGRALQIHHACLRRALVRHRGYESATEGDSFVMAFHRPDSAVAFAIEAQQELLDQDWPAELLESQVCAPVYTCIPTGFPFKKPAALEAVLAKMSIRPHSHTPTSAGPFSTPNTNQQQPQHNNSGTLARIAGWGQGLALQSNSPPLSRPAHQSPPLSRGASKQSWGVRQRASIDLGALGSLTARTVTNPLATEPPSCTAPVAAQPAAHALLLPPNAAGPPLRRFPQSRCSVYRGEQAMLQAAAGRIEPGEEELHVTLFDPVALPARASPLPGESPVCSSQTGPPPLRKPGELSRKLQEQRLQQVMPLQQQSMQQQQPFLQQQQQQEVRSSVGDKQSTMASSVSSGAWAIIHGGDTAAMLEEVEAEVEPRQGPRVRLQDSLAANHHNHHNHRNQRAEVADFVSAPTASTSRNPTGSGIAESAGAMHSGPEANDSDGAYGSELSPKMSLSCGGPPAAAAHSQLAPVVQEVQTAVTPAAHASGNSRGQLAARGNANGNGVDGEGGPYVTGGTAGQMWDVCTLEESLKAALKSYEEGSFGDRKRRPLWRGLRVRMGLHSGVSSWSELTHNRASARTVYSGDCASIVRAVSDSAQGGMVLLSEACVDALHALSASGSSLHGTAADAILVQLGRYNIRHKGLTTALYAATSAELAPRVAMLPPPRNITAVGLTTYAAPVGKAALAVLNMPDLAILRDVDAAATSQALATMEAVLMEQLAAHRGYLAAKDWEQGTMTAAFAFPLDALRWALTCRDMLSSAVSWPPSLLAHELCREGVLAHNVPGGASGQLNGHGGSRWGGASGQLHQGGAGSGPLPSPVSGRGPTRTSLELSHALTASCDNTPIMAAAVSAGGASTGGALVGGPASGRSATATGIASVTRAAGDAMFLEVRAGAQFVAASAPSYPVQRTGSGSVAAPAGGASSTSASLATPLVHQGSASLSVAFGGAPGAAPTPHPPGAAPGREVIPSSLPTRGFLPARSPTWRVRRMWSNPWGAKPPIRTAQSQGAMQGAAALRTSNGSPFARPPAVIAAVMDPVATSPSGSAPKSTAGSFLGGKLAALSARLRGGAFSSGFGEALAIGSGLSGAGSGLRLGSAGLQPVSAAAVEMLSSGEAGRVSGGGGGIEAGGRAGGEQSMIEGTSSGGVSPKPPPGLKVKTGVPWSASEELENEDGGDIFSGSVDGWSQRPQGISHPGGQDAGDVDRTNAVVLRGPRIRVGIDCGAVDWGFSTSQHCLIYNGAPVSTAEKLAGLAAGGQVLATTTVMLEMHRMQASLVVQAEPEDSAAVAGGPRGSEFASAGMPGPSLRGPAVVGMALGPTSGRTGQASAKHRRHLVFSCRFTLDWDEALREHEALAAQFAGAGWSSSPRGGRLSPFSSPWNWSAAGRLRSKRASTPSPVPGTAAADSRRGFNSRYSLDTFAPGTTPYAGGQRAGASPAAHSHGYNPGGMSPYSGPCALATTTPPLNGCRSNPLPSMATAASGPCAPTAGAAGVECAAGGSARVYASAGPMMRNSGSIGAQHRPLQQQQEPYNLVRGGVAAAGPSSAGGARVTAISTSAPINIVMPGPPSGFREPGQLPAPQLKLQPQLTHMGMPATIPAEYLTPSSRPSTGPSHQPAAPSQLAAPPQVALERDSRAEAAHQQRHCQPQPQLALLQQAPSESMGTVGPPPMMSRGLSGLPDGGGSNTEESFSLSLRYAIHPTRTGSTARLEGLGPLLLPDASGEPHTRLERHDRAPLLGQLVEVPEPPQLHLPSPGARAAAPPPVLLDDSAFASGVIGALTPAAPMLSPVAATSSATSSVTTFSPRMGPLYASPEMASSSGGGGGGAAGETGGSGGGGWGGGGGGGSSASGKLQQALRQHQVYARRQHQLQRLMQQQVQLLVAMQGAAGGDELPGAAVAADPGRVGLEDILQRGSDGHYRAAVFNRTSIQRSLGPNLAGQGADATTVGSGSCSNGAPARTSWPRVAGGAAAPASSPRGGRSGHIAANDAAGALETARRTGASPASAAVAGALGAGAGGGVSSTGLGGAGTMMPVAELLAAARVRHMGTAERGPAPPQATSEAVWPSSLLAAAALQEGPMQDCASAWPTSVTAAAQHVYGGSGVAHMATQHPVDLPGQASPAASQGEAPSPRAVSSLAAAAFAAVGKGETRPSSDSAHIGAGTPGPKSVNAPAPRVSHGYAQQQGSSPTGVCLGGSGDVQLTPTSSRPSTPRSAAGLSSALASVCSDGRGKQEADTKAESWSAVLRPAPAPGAAAVSEENGSHGGHGREGWVVEQRPFAALHPFPGSPRQQQQQRRSGLGPAGSPPQGQPCLSRSNPSSTPADATPPSKGLDMDGDFGGVFECRGRQTTAGSASVSSKLSSSAQLESAWAGDSGGFAAHAVRLSLQVTPLASPCQASGTESASASCSNAGVLLPQTSTTRGPALGHAASSASPFSSVAAAAAAEAADAATRTPDGSMRAIPPWSARVMALGRSPEASSGMFMGGEEGESREDLSAVVSEDLEDSRATVKPPTGWRPGVHPPAPAPDARRTPQLRVHGGAAAALAPSRSLARNSSATTRSDGTCASATCLTTLGVGGSIGAGAGGGSGRSVGDSTAGATGATGADGSAASGKASGVARGPFTRVSSSMCTLSLCHLNSVNHNLDEPEVWRDESYDGARLGACADSGRHA